MSKQTKEKTFKELVMERVVREETINNCLYEYDSNNNEIHYKQSDRYEYWKGYDSNNNEIHYKNSDGNEYWCEYNSNNNLIHFKNSNEYEYWKEYDSNNNEIHYKNSDGNEYWCEYNSNNNLIHFKNSNEYEYWNEYDSNNNMIHHKDSNGDEYWNEYDKNNNLIHYKDSNGYEYWYDSKGNIITKEEYNKLYNIHKEISDDDLQYYKLIYKYNMNSIDLMRTIINDIKNINLSSYEHLRFNNLCSLHDRYYSDYKDCIGILQQGADIYNMELDEFIELLK